MMLLFNLMMPISNDKRHRSVHILSFTFTPLLSIQQFCLHMFNTDVTLRVGGDVPCLVTSLKSFPTTVLALAISHVDFNVLYLNCSIFV